MDHPGDDVDLAVAASYAHGYVRALIAFTQQLGRDAPPRVHTAAATLAAWILDLDPDDERLQRAPRLLADDVEWRQLRVDKALEEVVRRLESPAYADRFAPVIGRLREALAAVCRIIGVMDHRRLLESPGGPSTRGGTRCCGIWTGSCRRRTWSAMTTSDDSWTAATRSQDGDPEG